MSTKLDEVARASASHWRTMGAAMALSMTLATGSAWAEVPAARPLVIGTPVSSQIDAGDRVVGGQYTEVYTLRLNAGDRVRLDMDAIGTGGTQSLDTYLRIFGENDAQLSFNDDRLDGTLNSRLIFEAPATGTYRVMAQGFGTRTGAYRLLASPLPPAPPVEVIAPGQHLVLLNDAAGVTDDLGVAYRYRDFEFAGAAGDRVYLRVLPVGTQAAAPAQATAQAGTDMLPDAVRVDMVLSAPGRDIATESGLPGFDDPRLFVILPDQARYRVRVKTPIAGDLRLTLDLQQQPDNPATAAAHVLPRTTTSLTGNLSLTSAVVPGTGNSGTISSLAETYAIPVRAGERVVATLSSTDFDPILDAGTISLVGYAVALTNNDSQGLNSRLELLPARPGIVHLRVRSTVPAIGRYELSIERSEAPPRPTPARAVARPAAPAATR